MAPPHQPNARANRFLVRFISPTRSYADLMGSRGPLPQSNIVRINRGNPSGRKAPVHPRAPKKAAIKAPSGLDPASRALYLSWAQRLDDQGTFEPADSPALVLAVDAYRVARAAAKELLKSGSTVDDRKNDRLAKHPASQVLRDQGSLFLAFARQLVMTPDSRLRTNLAIEEPSNDEDLFDS
jgi:P27 family predicted phage terminase small subunit